MPNRNQLQSLSDWIERNHADFFDELGVDGLQLRLWGVRRDEGEGRKHAGGALKGAEAGLNRGLGGHGVVHRFGEAVRLGGRYQADERGDSCVQAEGQEAGIPPEEGIVLGGC